MLRNVRDKGAAVNPAGQAGPVRPVSPKSAAARAGGILFRRMGAISLWYIGIFAVVVLALTIVFEVFHIAGMIDITYTAGGDAYVFANSNSVFLLVLGILFPLLSLEPLLAVGATRRQFAIGLLSAAAALAIGFAVICAVLDLLAGSFSLPRLFTYLTDDILFFLTGWAAVIGFQIRLHVFPAAFGILCAWGLLAGSKLLAEYAGFSEPAKLCVSAVLIVLAAVLLVKASRDISLKC
jgi:hypothetical protein